MVNLLSTETSAVREEWLFSVVKNLSKNLATYIEAYICAQVV